MQPFIPFPDLELSAMSFDKVTLRQQRLVIMSIINAIDGRTHGFRFHPAVKMFRGYRPILVHYGIIICKEWERRRIKGSCRKDFEKLVDRNDTLIINPPWLGDALLHKSHRSNLIKRDPAWYRDGLKWTEPDDIPYIYLPMEES